jgi:hypothetical protein
VGAQGQDGRISLEWFIDRTLFDARPRRVKSSACDESERDEVLPPLAQTGPADVEVIAPGSAAAAESPAAAAAAPEDADCDVSSDCGYSSAGNIWSSEDDDMRLKDDDMYVPEAEAVFTGFEAESLKTSFPAILYAIPVELCRSGPYRLWSTLVYMRRWRLLAHHLALRRRSLP